METIKINDLEDANSISETDYLIIEKKDGTKKISAAYLKGEQGSPGKDGSFDPNQEFEDLTTTSKTIVNAINEVNMQISNKTNDLNEKIAILDNMINPLTISFNNNKNTIEMGTTISSTTLTWDYSRTDIASQSINDIEIDISLRSITLTDSYSSDKTFTLKATTTSGLSKSASTKVVFYNGIYYGKSISTEYTDTLFSSLTKILSNTRVRNITVNTNENEYIYYCIPSRFGIPIFYIGGFEGGLERIQTISFTNSNGYIEDYDIYRSDMSGLGNTTITIK